jgi:hypothetical protein
VQGEITGALEEGEGLAAVDAGLALGKEFGRVVPMVEAGWTLPSEGENLVAFYPQLWVQLSRLGHVAASLGAELPAVGPDRETRLIAFVLWDFGDAGLFRGW